MPLAASIFLCDLTYTQQTIASDVMPAAVGCLATYAEQELGDAVSFSIFKFPEDLIAALEGGARPSAVCFSNYCWNEDLGTSFAATIKRHLPSVVTIFGGPNYPTARSEQERFLKTYPQIDFYVAKEGEVAFSKLIKALIDCDFRKEEIALDMPSVHRIVEEKIVTGLDAPRIRDMTQIPSPYLSGKMDRFFDGTMLPIIQTNRGCPFQCTFCVEGVDYFNKIAKSKTVEKTEAELEYIAARMADLRDNKGGRADLHIADSNFGMYREDMDICRSIAEKQSRYSYPEYINVATGKNHKERVLEAATVINGALRLSGSVQSLDPDVLTNIKRSNINVQQIMELALDASRIGANSYSEIILGLPGDTLEGHLNTIKIIVEADFNIVCLYQLMLLPGTDLASDASIERWNMVTKYRAIPRCYGHFELFGDQIVACEIERICVSNASLTFRQYLDSRKMHLVVNLFYNDGVFKEALRFLRGNNLPVYEWLELIYNDDENEGLLKLVDEFLLETEQELWDDRDDFRAFTRVKENIEQFIAGNLGANLIFKFRSKALLQHPADLSDVAIRAMKNLCARYGLAESKARFGCELIEFGRARMTHLFDLDAPDPVQAFSFDVVRFADNPDLDADYELPSQTILRFSQNEEQHSLVERYLTIYGNSLPGLSRILSKIYVRRLFRQPIDVTTSESITVGAKDLRFGQAALTGLNQFGG